MSDALTDMVIEQEESKLAKLNPHAMAAYLRDNYKSFMKYQNTISDLRKLGYKVDINDCNVKVWKEI